MFDPAQASSVGVGGPRQTRRIGTADTTRPGVAGVEGDVYLGVHTW